MEIFPGASEDAKVAVELDPQDPEPHIVVGRIFAMGGRNEQALDCIARLLYRSVFCLARAVRCDELLGEAAFRLGGALVLDVGGAYFWTGDFYRRGPETTSPANLYEIYARFQLELAVLAGN